MERIRTCAVCGRKLVDPSSGASVCSRCLLQDVQNLLADDTPVDLLLDGGVGEAHVGMDYSTAEVPGRYTREREHARGGMGRILLAHDEQLGRDIVLKELLGDKKNDSGEPRPPGRLRESTPVAARFAREARIAGQLEHPSIIPVHELGFRENGDLYYTMKYVEGVSLSESIEKASGLGERLELLPHVLDVCQAIAYAHSRGVIHRDIKPANIMVGSFGETVVLDWGLARVKSIPEDANGRATPNNGAIDMGGESDSAKTAYGEIIGTPAYMAPEQAQGRGDEVDERTDQFALGALLYTLLTGKPPFSGDKRDDTIRQAATRALEPIHQLEPKAPAELVAICEKAMAPDPAQRYSSAKELAEELQRFLTGGLVSAYHYHVSEHLRRFARRHRNILATAALAAVILIAVGVVSYLRVVGERNAAVQARNTAVEARDEAVLARAQTDQQLYSTSIALAHAAVETGRLREAKQAVLSAPENYRHWEWGLMAALSHPDLLILRNPAGTVHQPRFSPDGRWIASTDDRGEVHVWDAATGKLVRRLHWGDTGFGKSRFSPDSRLVAAGFDDGWLSLWEVETGRRVLRIRAHEMKTRALEFDPSGQTIATASSDGTCTLWDVRTGQKRLTLEGVNSRRQDVAFSRDGQRIGVSSDHTTARVWDAASGRELMRLEGHKGAVAGVAFSPDGRWIATGNMDRTARLWDAETGALVRVLEGHTGELSTVLFSPDSRRLYTGSRDRTVAIWSLPDGQREQVLEGCASSTGIFHVDFTSQRLVTYVGRGGAREGVVRSLEPLHDVVVLRGHTGPVMACAFSPDSRLVATGAGHWYAWDDNRAIVWDAATGRQLTVLEGHGGPVNDLAFVAGGEQILTGSDDGTAALWEVRSGKRLRTYGELVPRPSSFTPRGHCEIRTLAVTPDERTFMTAGWDDVARVRVWEVDTGRQVAILDASVAHPQIDGLTIDPKGRYLVAVTRSATVVVWDIASGQEVTRLKHSSGPAALRGLAAFSTDARTLAHADGAAIRLWDTQTWKSIASYEGHTSSVEALYYHPQGGRLASGGRDATVRLWDTVTGREVLLLNNIGPVAFSPDGLTLATADGTTVVVWRAFPWRVEDYPGDPDMPFEDRIQLAREARERDVAERERLADEWQKEAEQREACHEQLLQLDDAKLAWAEANTRNPEDTVASVSDLQPYLADSNTSMVCPSGGTYELGAVRDLPSCSEHRAPDENPALMARFKDVRSVEELAFQVTLERLQRAIDLEPENESHWFRRGRLHAEFGQFADAAQDFAKVVELPPDNAYNWYLAAMAQLASGDMQAYQATCMDIIERFHETDSVSEAVWAVWTCVLMPDAVSDMNQPLQLAETASRGSDANVRFERSQEFAVALYRAGQLDEALLRLQTVANDPPRNTSPAYSWFFLAMTHYRLGHEDEAQAWLQKAIDQADAEIQDGAAWNRVFTLQLLREEAETLLNGMEVADPASGPTKDG